MDKQQKINEIQQNLKVLGFDDLDTKNIIEKVLNKQRRYLIKKYNIYNIEVDEEDFKIRDYSKMRTLQNIEEDIKTYFSKYTKQDKIKELVKKLNLFSYGAFDCPKSKKLFFDDNTTRLIELKKGEITFSIYWDSINFGKEQEVSITRSRDELENIKQLFKLVLDVDLSFNAEYGYKPFYKQPLSDWQNTNGFKYKAYLNGKFKIQANEQYLKPIKDLFKEHYNQYEHFKIIEK